MKYKVGDKIRYVGNTLNRISTDKIGWIGVIEKEWDDRDAKGNYTQAVHVNWNEHGSSTIYAYNITTLFELPSELFEI
jgi:hypothetical protein